MTPRPLAFDAAPAPRFRGALVNLDLQDVVSGEVTGTITLRLKHVPWDQALELVARTRDLELEREGNVIVVRNGRKAVRASRRMRRRSTAVLVGLALSSTLGTACSLLVDTNGLAGTGDAGTTPAVEGSAGDAPSTDAPSPTCVSSDCVAPPLPPCNGPCLPRQIVKETELRGLAADESGVYWTAPVTGDVKRAAVDGTSVVTVYAGNKSPSLIVLDSTNVYWTESNDGTVNAARKDGNKASRVSLAGFPLVYGLAVSQGEVFFHERTNFEVQRSQPALVSSTHVTTTEATKQVVRLAADANNIYIAVSSGVNVVQSVPRAGTTAAPTNITTRVGDLRDFAIDDTRVYYADTKPGGRVLSEKLDGSGSAITHAPNEASPTCVAVDATHIYWGTLDDGRIRRVAKAGGTPEDVASGQSGPFAIALNSQGVYWLNGDGTVMTVKKP